MKHRYMVAVLLLSVTGFAYGASAPRLELGVIIGEPTGLSGKYWLSSDRAINFAAAWSFSNEGRLALFADYLFHPYTWFVESGSVMSYVGPGGSVRLGKDSELTARVVLGGEYFFETVPLTLFIELAPGLVLIPATSLDLAGGFGVRWTF